MKETRTELLLSLIEEVLEDTRMFGASKRINYFKNITTGVIEDYSFEEDNVIFLDEIKETTTLFQFLVAMMMEHHILNGNQFPWYAIMAKTCRNLKADNITFSQAKFAKFIGVTTNAVEVWEAGRKKPNFESLMLISKKCNIEIGILAKAMNGDLSL